MSIAPRIAGVLGVLLVAAASIAVAQDEGRVVTAKSGILIDNQTGHVIWQRSPDLPLPPASTTKIVTAMVALESGRLEDPLWVSSDAANTPPSKIGVRAGWQMRLRDLVYALLLNSANDASVVIAEGLSGTIENFAQRMNRHARRLGAWNTHFVNPNGLPADDHYSTARDLAIMFGRGLENSEFAEIVGTKTTAIMPAAGSSRIITLRNHNRLLDDYHIQVVGKTGWTRASKKCFVGAGTADGHQILVAVLGSTDLWGDLKTLFAFGFQEEPGPILEPQFRMARVDRDALAAPDSWERATAAASLTTAFGNPSRPARAPRAPAVTSSAINTARAKAKAEANKRGTAAPRDRRHAPVTAQGDKAGPAYSVQVGAFSTLPQAEKVRTAMARKGYKATISRVRQKKGDLYRVTIGGYRDRGEAQQAAKRIARTHPELRTGVDG